MILADTNIWIEYLKHDRVPGFVELLINDEIVLSFWVKLELLSGVRDPKEKTFVDENLRGVALLPKTIHNEEIYGFLLKHSLNGKGLSAIDITLLAETALNQAKLWTADKALKKASKDLNLCFER